MARIQKRRAWGSVRKLKRKNLKKEWEYRYKVGGKRKGGLAYTRREAEDLLNRALVMLSDGSISGDDPKFSDYCKVFLDMKENTGNTVKEKTLVSYANNLKHICKYIGTKKLSEIRGIDLTLAYTELRKQGLSSTSVHSIHRTTRTLWNTAMKQGLVTQNVIWIADAPKVQKRVAIAISRKEMGEIIKATYSEYDGLIIHLIMMTGMRADREALETKWHQIDFDTAELTVGESKTEAGEGRVINLDKPLMDRLEKRQSEHEGFKHITKGSFNPNNYVLCNQKGNRHLLSNVHLRVWKRVKKIAGVNPKLTLQDLRHNYGSYLISEGVPPATISEVMGHADISTTYKHYAHELKEDRTQLKKAMAKMSEMVKN